MVDEAQLPEITTVKTSQLRADAQNPRFADGEDTQTQEQLIARLWKEMAAEEVAMSIAANGFFVHEPLFVEEKKAKGASETTYTVIEGNRRFAAVKILTDDKLRRDVGATDLPKLTAAAKARLEDLPVIICSRKDVWQFIGFKHVNGPQVWESYSKAKYIAWVHNELNIDLDEIATRIGDQHATVQRLYRAYMVLQQAEDSAVFDRENRAKKHFSFSHLYTGLSYPGFQSFLGLKGDGTSSKTPVPKSKSKELGELMLWLYGSKDDEKQPLVRSQNPDLKQLDEALQAKNSIAALRAGLPLKVSVAIGRGDERLFREALVAAKQSLEEARSKVLTGYKREKDLLIMAEAIRILADSIATEMATMAARKARS